MTLPVMEPDLDANLLKRWARLIDEGPFSSLCWGERIAFNNPDSLTLLGALSAWTERVPLVTTVVVLAACVWVALAVQWAPWPGLLVLALWPLAWPRETSFFDIDNRERSIR